MSRGDAVSGTERGEGPATGASRGVRGSGAKRRYSPGKERAAAADRMIAARGNRARAKYPEGRKVRTPQGSAPGNTRAGQPDGKWHRKNTASAQVGVRVKRCGKSAPRGWQQPWQAKPRTEQDQIGKRMAPAIRTARPIDASG